MPGTHDIVKIRMTTDDRFGSKGQVMEIERHVADLVVERGVAVFVEPPKSKRISSPPRNKAVAAKG